jgi:hypothetical protein
METFALPGKTIRIGGFRRMNKKFSKSWIAAVNKTSTKLDALRDLQSEAHHQYTKMHAREREQPVAIMLKTLMDIKIQEFEDAIQASATDFEDTYDPLGPGKGKKGKVKKEKK